MSLRNFANAPETTLAASCTSLAVTIQVTSTSGLPISYPFILILDRGGNTEEVVLVTAAAGATLTVTRGYDSTTAFAHTLGATVAHGISAIDAREANTHVNALTGVHGIAGGLVGTSDAQVLLNKTIGGSNNLTGFAASKFMQSDGTGKIVSGTKAIPSGVVVGDTDSQTLTNKTLTNPTINNPSVGTGTFSSPVITSPTITGPGQILRAVKGSDETVTASTALQDDDALTIAIPAIGTYMFELWLLVDAAGPVPDIKVAMTYTGTSSLMRWGLLAPEVASGDLSASLTRFTAEIAGGSLAAGLGSNESNMVIKGSVFPTSTGNLKLRWCQNTSDAGAVLVKAGSWMRVERIS